MNAKPDDAPPLGLGYWVGSLASAMRKGLENELAPFGVTASQWAILATCYRGDANTVTGLARVIPVDPAAISRHLDNLSAKKLIRRRRLASDRRSVRINLTEAGRALVPRLVPSVDANTARFLKGISKDEHAALIRIIRKMLAESDRGVNSDE